MHKQAHRGRSVVLCGSPRNKCLGYGVGVLGSLGPPPSEICMSSSALPLMREKALVGEKWKWLVADWVW